jgi:cysteine desulfurase/selenocysteine lyase
MTPNKPNQGKPVSPNEETRFDALRLDQNLPAGALDPVVISRMANEFFKSLPGLTEMDEGNIPPAARSMPVAREVGSLNTLGDPVKNLPVPGAGAADLSQADLNALPASLGETSWPAHPLVDMGAPVWIPGVPADLGAMTSSAPPSFSFIQDARPLFSSVPASANPVAASSSAPEGYSQNFPSPNRIPLIPDGNVVTGNAPGSIPANLPAVPGAVQRLPAADARASLPFLKEIRHLGPIDVIPVLEPIGFANPGVSDLGLSSRPFEVGEIRRDFPILQERVNGRPLVWLDNAATTQKPQSVIDRLSYFYAHENSNVHRAAHELAARATDAYEGAREKVRRFLNASSKNEIVFVRGATEAINLIAQSWGRQNIQKGDEIVITWLEHHANIVPWQMLCAEKGARLRVAPVDDSGQILLDEYAKLLGPRTRLVSIAQVSNALGTVTPAQQMIEMAHHYGATAVLDGAQSVSHMPVDVQLLDCDLFVFSGHKVFAPTGIGVVYGKSAVLDRMPPWQGGGNMIADVTFEKTVYQAPPGRFEAGTGSIADAVGLGAAIDYVERVGMANIARYEHDLLVYATESLQSIPGLRMIGTATEKAGVLSFVLDGLRTEDLSAALNLEGIAVRSGHHCAQPILRRFGVEATVRASLALYNTCEEIDALVAAIWNLKQGLNPGLV